MDARLRFAAALLALLATGASSVSASEPVAGYIVVLHEGVTPASPSARGHAQAELARRHGVEIGHGFRHALNGFAARLTHRQHTRLASDPAIASIELDWQEQVLEGSGSQVVASAPGRHVDDSLRRIGADVANPSGQNGLDDERPDVDIAVLDSGIAPLPDLNVAGGYNCTGSNRAAYTDVYGHGTEVAAVTAALDNDDGIVGVLPGARLWSVKMITNSGGTTASMVLCAVDWVAGRRDAADASRPLIEVANMSFTIRSGAKTPVDDGNCGRTSGDLLHRAICRMTRGGTIGVAAAGNHGRKVGTNRPAAFGDVISVSALADFDGRSGGRAPFDEACLPEARDEDDTFANFSNYGPAIDIIAPGVCMTMPWIRTGGTLHQQSGTSFASPLVAGTVGLYLTRHPNATERQVRHALDEAATLDWFTRTDPDSRRDRLLNLINLRPPDTTPPSAAVSGIGFATGRRSPAAKAPLALSLVGADDRSTALTFQLQSQLEGGAWVSLASGPGASVVHKVPLGAPVRFRVRATDAAGNTGPWTETPALVARLIDSRSSAVLYSGTWRTVSQSSAFGGSVRGSTTAGSQARLTVDARAVALAVTAGPSRGKGRLTVDGEAATFETLRSVVTTRWLVAGRRWTTDEARAVSVSVLGTTGRPRVEMDGLLVLVAAP